MTTSALRISCLVVLLLIGLASPAHADEESVIEGASLKKSLEGAKEEIMSILSQVELEEASGDTPVGNNVTELVNKVIAGETEGYDAMQNLEAAKQSMNEALDGIKSQNPEFGTIIDESKAALAEMAANSVKDDTPEDDGALQDLHKAMGSTNSLRAQIIELSDILSFSCVDNHKEVRSSSNGKANTCSEALDLYKLNDAACDDDLGFGPLSNLCPVTCGLCTTGKALTASIDKLKRQLSIAKSSLASAQAAMGSSSSSASEGFIADPKGTMERLGGEVMERHQKGTLFKPLFDSFRPMIDLFSNLTQGG